MQIRAVGEDEIDTAAVLLSRFFAEERFPGTPQTVAFNTRVLRADPQAASALVWSVRICT
jgi:hypothetical protein